MQESKSRIARYNAVGGRVADGDPVGAVLEGICPQAQVSFCLAALGNILDQGKKAFHLPIFSAVGDIGRFDKPGAFAQVGDLRLVSDQPAPQRFIHIAGNFSICICPQYLIDLFAICLVSEPFFICLVVKTVTQVRVDIGNEGRHGIRDQP